jgi:hypothetical protein
VAAAATLLDVLPASSIDRVGVTLAFCIMKSSPS